VNTSVVRKVQGRLYIKFRIMQKYLNQITPDDLDFIINRLNTGISRLMTDIYGNYFCQKLIQICSSDQRIKILNYVLYK